MFLKQIRPAIFIFIILTVICGVIYPFLITVIAQAFFPAQANGSLIYRNTKIVGSALIGQQFDGPEYLWGRVSATSPYAYNASSSSGSNLGPLNPVLLVNIKARIEKLRRASPQNERLIPVDLVTSSASGLDPHISAAAANYQIPRIAKQRRIPRDVVKNIIQKNTSGRLFGVLGEPVVNVLGVNLDLESYKK
jgi:K+-transporting ATPase ATPase C chain